MQSTLLFLKKLLIDFRERGRGRGSERGGEREAYMDLFFQLFIHARVILVRALSGGLDLQPWPVRLML